MHELATSANDLSGAHLELLQDEKAPQPPATVRCPSCGGLRSIAYRNRDTPAFCPSCRKGKVVRMSQYHNYWLKRFTREEIEAMAKAIWG